MTSTAQKKKKKKKFHGKYVPRAKTDMAPAREPGQKVPFSRRWVTFGIDDAVS